jgi:tRNA(Ile)-lysidine synthetase-like protein
LNGKARSYDLRTVASAFGYLWGVHSLPDGRILLAFSGGPDSVGLAARLRSRNPLLAYVDHRLRGVRESRRERCLVAEAADALGLDLVRGRLSLGGARGETAARKARYDLLHALARKHRCAALATAHTADDRAETILFNLERGTGLRGLGTPLPRAVIGGVLRVRPALDERRVDLHREAASFGSVADRTNRTTAYARGRTRGLQMPALWRLLGEDPVPLLCALGDAAASMRGELERRARAMAPGADRRRLLSEAEAVFPYLVEVLRGAGPPLTSNGYRSLRAFLRAGHTGRVHVTPGGEAWRLLRGNALRINRTT